MRIKMISRQRGSPHGHDCFWYEPNRIYDAGSTPPMTDSLAAAFLRAHWAIDVSRKDLGGAPENKFRQRGRPGKTRVRQMRPAIVALLASLAFAPATYGRTDDGAVIELDRLRALHEPVKQADPPREIVGEEI